MNRTILIVSIFFLSSCAIPSGVNKSYYKEIKKLKGDEAHISFLEETFDQDQKYRKSKKMIQENLQALYKQDQINLEKVEIYLQRYGYPSFEKYGKKASSAPWYVLQHAKTLQPRTRNFKYIYSGWKEGDVFDWMMYHFLLRYYKFQHDELPKISGSDSDSLKAVRLMEMLELGD